MKRKREEKMGGYCGGLILLAVLAAEDMKEKKISVYKLLIFALFAVCYRLAAGDLFLPELLGALLPGSLLLLLSRATKEGIGYGDGMAVLVLGLWTGGWFACYVMMIGIVLTGIYGFLCLARKKREAIPFLPFLLAGMEVALFYG